MELKRKQQAEHYLFWAILVGLVIHAILIVKPYLIALISAFILAYLMRPLYVRLTRALSPRISAALCILFIMLLILIPLGFIANAIVQQASALIQNQELSSLLSSLSQHPIFEQWNIDIASLQEKGLALLITLITDLLVSLPQFVISLVIIGFGMYAILLNWERLARALIAFLPFEKKTEIAAEIDATTQGIVRGILFLASLEFIIALLGFSLAGVGSPIILATLIFIFAFIPGLGPAVVWLPTALFYLFTAAYGTAIGVFITGVAISIGMEMFLMPKLVSQKSKIHPFVMLLGVIGGISLFGIFGFIIGPIILSYTVKLIESVLKKP